MLGSYLSLAEAYSTEVVTLCVFGTLAIIYSTFKEKRSNIQEKVKIINFFSSRNTISWLPLALTSFASQMGNWTLFLPGDFAGYYSWAGLIGYVIGSGICPLLYVWLGPKVREASMEDEFSGTDFILRKFGIIPYTIMTLVSLLFMFVVLTAEMTTVAQTVNLLTGGKGNDVASIIPMAVITLLYTTIAGLKASIFTDQFQGVSVLIFGIIFMVTSVVSVPSEVLKASDPLPFAPAGAWIAGSVLFLTIYPSELMNQGNWQRVFAAKSIKDIRVGFTISSVAVMAVILSFGYGGIFAARLPQTTVGASGYLLSVMTYLPSGWLVLVLILAVCLASSSIDTMQSALSALIGHHLIAGGFSKKWSQVATVLINIPAIVVASFGLNVLKLFSMANLLCLVVAIPNFYSLNKRATKWGLVAGCAVGLLTMLSTGWVKTRSFVGGFEFLYPADLSSIYYIVASLLTPLLSLISVIIVSWLEGGYGKKGKKANSNSVEA